MQVLVLLNQCVEIVMLLARRAHAAGIAIIV
ncbi:hypothetical protein AF72_11285 [Xylella taiwanensis]|uniref:Uncharacterized protein n=1 Tax=Xylella taiwanensis TaxID=1444770 RepID=Z9JH44_9GAMM|nr:hypothetical protein AF72_11285 [Xylella taiwanensis]